MIYKTLCFLALLTISLTGFGQHPSQGLLWEISGNGLDKPSYLYGTMHVSNKVAFHLSDSFYTAISNVDVVALEINPETWMEIMTTDEYVVKQMGNPFSTRGEYSNTGYYKSMFECSSPGNRDLGNMLAQDFMILNALLYRTDGYSEDFQEETYLDLFIYQAGKKLGKDIAGLENLAVTMRLSEEASRIKYDAESLKFRREENERRRAILQKLIKDVSLSEAIENAYRTGDLDLLDTLSKLSDVNDLYHELMIVVRNRGMAKAMDSIMRSRSLFAGVGAAHLPNSYGVLQLLRNMGYTVRPVGNLQTERGEDFKEDLEQTFIAHSFTHSTSTDACFSTYLPGKLYEFPESNNSMVAVFPDMANGATYMITRKNTFGVFYNISPEQFRRKVDSLLFENIPGKIHEKTEIEVSGFPAIDVLNETKTGDFQRYRIIFTPLEILVFKLAGLDEFAKRQDVSVFFDSIRINRAYYGNKGLKEFVQFNHAYSVETNGMAVYEPSINSYSRRYWKRNFQSYDTERDVYYGVFNRSYGDYNYMEEDSFELGVMSRYFVKQFGYTISRELHDSFGPYTSYRLTSEKKDCKDLHSLMLVKGEQYYLLVCISDDPDDFDRFKNSFQFMDYVYVNPFKEQEDTNLYYSVISPVEPELSSGASTYSYYSVRNEHKHYEEKSKTSRFYCDETDESISVFYFKFHRYYHAAHADSIFNKRRDLLTNDGEFFVRSQKKWQVDSLYYMEMEITDTNSGRNVIGRFVLCTDRVYSIYAETDKHMERSKFVSEFLNSFHPWDTLIGENIFKSKVPLLVADLRSEDTVLRNAAMASFKTIHFTQEDVPELMKAINQPYLKRISVEVRTELYRAMYYLKSAELPAFLAAKYRQAADTAPLQLAILRTLANQETRESTQLVFQLLNEETPISATSLIREFLVYPFSDSLALLTEIYPEMLVFTRIPEYKPAIYDQLASLVSINLIKPRNYKKFLKQILLDANNDLSRYKAMLFRHPSKTTGSSVIEHSGYITGGTFGYALDASVVSSYNLVKYAIILFPFADKNRDVQEFMDRLYAVNEPDIRMTIALARLAANLRVDEELWNEIASKVNYRYSLYDALQKLERLDLFPAEYLDTDLLVAAKLFRLDRTLETEDSIVLLRKEYMILDHDSGYVYVFKVLDAKTEKWKMMVVGLLPADSTDLEIKHNITKTYLKYYKYQDEELQVDLVIRSIEMAHRKRYKVEDEEKFKELQTSDYMGY